ncbi:MAG: HAD family phosphatase [Nanoarchaeota archaeon]
MIKAVIFDYNGVITVPGDFESFLADKAKKTNREATAIQRLVREHWDRAKVGALDSELLWVQAADYFHCPRLELRQEWLSWFRLRKDLLLFIKQLKRNYKTALLTNIIRDWFEQVRPEQHLDDYFDVIVTSYEAQAAKPQPAIFKYALDQLGLKAEECIFVDDQEKNIRAAAALGFKTILFSSAEQLQQELSKPGVSKKGI